MADSNLHVPTPSKFKRLLGAAFLGGAAVGVIATLTFGAMRSDPVSDSGKEEDASDRAKPTLTSGRKAQNSEPSYEDLTPRQASAGLEQALVAATAATKESELNALVDKASKFDPQASFDTALALSDPERRRDVLRRVIGSWILQDRETAMAAIGQVKNVALRRDLLKSAVSSLSRSKPAEAVDILRGQPSLRDDSLWEESFSIWTKADPDAALAAWRSLKHPEERRDALRGIAETLVQKDLASAISWATELSADGGKSEALYAVLRQAANANPVLAAEQIDLLKHLDDRSARDVAAQIAEEWAGRDLSTAVEWAEKLPADQRDSAMREIARDLIRQDPDAAEAIVRGISDTGKRRELFGEIARLRVLADAEDAIAWIAGLPDQDQRSAWRSAAYEWSRTRPEEAAAFALTENVDDYTRRQIIESAAPQWARTDPASAADWALTVPGKAGEAAMGYVVDTWSQRDPAAAIAFVADRVEGEQGEALTRRAVSAWSREQPAEAAAYAGSLEAGETKSAIFRSVTDRWMSSDSIAASEWVASLEPSEERDSAVGTLIYRIEREDLDAAFIWADTITDDKRRTETIKRLERHSK